MLVREHAETGSLRPAHYWGSNAKGRWHERRAGRFIQKTTGPPVAPLVNQLSQWNIRA